MVNGVCASVSNAFSTGHSWQCHSILSTECTCIGLQTIPPGKRYSFPKQNGVKLLIKKTKIEGTWGTWTLWFASYLVDLYIIESLYMHTKFKWRLKKGCDDILQIYKWSVV